MQTAVFASIDLDLHYRSKWRQRAIVLTKLDQVLEDQRSPSGSARLDEQTALGEPAEIDGREAELFVTVR